MAYRRNSRSRSTSYRRSSSGGYRGRSTVGRRSTGRARRGSGGVRQQTVKIVLQTTPAPAISSAFGQQVEQKPQRAKF